MVPEMLKKIIDESRRYAMETLNTPTLVNCCDTARNYIIDRIKDLRLQNAAIYPIEISDVVPTAYGHSILILEIDGKQYLIDPTYMQFIPSEEYMHSKEEYSQIPNTPYWRFYSDIKDKFITDGYTEMTESFIASYFNSFYLTSDSMAIELAYDEIMKSLNQNGIFLERK